MKILILSKWGGGTALGERLVKEGHTVRMWIKPDKGGPCHVGDGFVEKVNDLDPNKKWADFIIVDDGELGKISEQAKNEGKVVWGGTAWSDEIEMDRGKGQKTLQEIGMNVPASKEFTSPKDAAAFVKAHPGRYVAKPSGPIQDEKALTYCGKEDDGQDMVTVLELFQQKWAGKITKIELQEFKKGVEVGISGFFTGKEFVEPIEVSFEHKKLMNDNIGPSTGEMGTSMVWMNKNKIFRESIGRMTKILAKNRYTGYIDINCIATKEALYPLEFTTRFGYPTIYLKMETIRGSFGDWMHAIARGQSKNLSVTSPYSVCVVVATPPYPFASDEIFEKYGEDQKVIFKGKERGGIWPGEILRDGPDWYLTGGGGFSVIVTGSGKTVKDAKELAYKRVDSFLIPNSFWRTDISDRTAEDLKTLAGWGYFKP